MPAGDMDSEYSVGIKNRFIGIDSDVIEDPLEIIRAAQEKPKKEKEVKGKGAKKEGKQTTKSTKERTVKVETVQSPTETKRTDYNADRTRGRGRGGRGRGGDRPRGRGGRGGGFGSSNNDEHTSSYDGPRPQTRKACHRCGDEGHIIKYCPQQPKSPGVPPSDSGFGAPVSGFGGNSGGYGNDDEERQGGRGGFRGGRGGRGGRGRGRGGAREFDRRSGSDRSSVKAFEKRDGSGSYNWGTPQDDLAASEEQQSGGFGAPKESDDAPVESTEEIQEGGNVSGSDENENKENGTPEMSFADYKKQQEESRSKPQHNIRKANEGEKVKGLKQLKKPTEEDNEADGSLFFPKKYYEEKLKTSGRVKEHMNLEFQFATGDNRHMDTDRGRRGGRRGGRGGSRGGRNRDESSGYGGSSQIQLENNEEFPSLG